MDNVYIVMPAYNEEANIESVVKDWIEIVDMIGHGSKLVVVNDGSKDKTSEILHSLNLENLVILDKANSGHGPSLIYGYKYALEKNPSYIFQTDSDGQTFPFQFWKFWNEREKYEVIIGHRKGREDGFSRVIVTKTLKLVLKLIFKETVVDANTPFRLMKSSVLKEKLELIPDDFFLSNVLLAILFVKDKNINVKFDLIGFKPRQGGVNSINLKRIFKIGLKSLNEFSEIKKELNI